MIEKLFHTLSENIWDRIRDSVDSGIRQGEESITDNILLEIFRARPFGVKTIQTPKLSESQKGCDWEWWIGSDNDGWQRYAVQTKKIQPHNAYYPSLNYKVGKPPHQQRQLDILLNYAEVNNAIPLYSFYNYLFLKEDELIEYWNAELPFEKKLLGWTYTPAHIIQNVLDPKIKKGHRRFFQYIHTHKETLAMRSLIRKKYPFFVDTQDVINREGKVGYYQKSPKNFRDSIAGDYGGKIPLASKNSIFKELSIEEEKFKNAYLKKFYDKELQQYPKQIMIINDREGY